MDDACDFMPGNARILNAGPAILREHVAVANTTGLHLDENLPRTGLRNLPLDDLEISSRFGNLRNFHWCDSDSCSCHTASFFVRHHPGFIVPY